MKKMRPRVLENNAHVLSQFCRRAVGRVEAGDFHISTNFSLDNLWDETSQNTSERAFPAARRSGHDQAFTEANVK
jgi:regulator of sigma D